jgi:F0F1-type ATP synthase membrane subunit c/vacuolar-type H+-ATPase subunit K
MVRQDRNGALVERPPLRERLLEGLRTGAWFGLAWGIVSLVSGLMLALVYRAVREPPMTSRDALILAGKILFLVLFVTVIPIIGLVRAGRKDRK